MRQVANNSIQMTGRSEVKPLPSLGFNRQERSQYSIVKAMRDFMLLGEGKRIEPGIELEAHAAIEKLTGRSSQGLLVPTADLQWMKRDVMTASTPYLGGNLVQTELSSDFIFALKSKVLLAKMGATVLTELVGNVDFPRKTGTSQTHWLSEGETIPQSSMNFDLVSLRPRTIGAIVPLTRRLMLQASEDAEFLLRQDLLSEIALGIDDAAIDGTGLTNQPLGILHTPGVGSVALGANGGAPTWSMIVELETKVSDANADVSAPTLAYLTNSKCRGKLKTTAKVTGQDVFLWTDHPNPMAGRPGEGRSIAIVNSSPAFCTNLVPSDGVKGNGTSLSSIIYGDFSQLMIATWGLLEILPNQFGAGYEQGTLQLRAMLDADCAIRHPESFAVCQDIVTA